MNSDEEINQLREKIQNTISEAGGISNLLTTLANQANYKGLPDAGRRCNKIATETVNLNGQAIPVCKEHYNKINS